MVLGDGGGEGVNGDAVGRLSNPSKSGLLERDERVLGTSEGGSDDSVDDGDALLALVEPAT